jgi:hypothetical protein
MADESKLACLADETERDALKALVRELLTQELGVTLDVYNAGKGTIGIGVVLSLGSEDIGNDSIEIEIERG